MATIERDRALVVVEKEGRRIAELGQSSQGALDSAVAPCPGWLLRDLLDHLGGVYAWVTTVVESGAESRPPRDETHRRAEPESVEGWFAHSHQGLLDTLGSVPAETRLWNFVEGPGASVAFWWRRQMHETMIHRADAELAVTKTITPLEPDLAADCVSEVFDLLAYERVGWDELEIGDGLSVHLHATDLDDAEWTVDSKRKQLTTAHLKADVAVRGPASAIALWLWGRPATELEIFGDQDSAEAWRKPFGR